jgi:hypothetical protein
VQLAKKESQLFVCHMERKRIKDVLVRELLMNDEGGNAFYGLRHCREDPAIKEQSCKTFITALANTRFAAWQLDCILRAGAEICLFQAPNSMAWQYKLCSAFGNVDGNIFFSISKCPKMLYFEKSAPKSRVESFLFEMYCLKLEWWFTHISKVCCSQSDQM